VSARFSLLYRSPKFFVFVFSFTVSFQSGGENLKKLAGFKIET
jgi:hypothetical protein